MVRCSAGQRRRVGRVVGHDHRARLLVDHVAPQPLQEPLAARRRHGSPTACSAPADPSTSRRPGRCRPRRRRTSRPGSPTFFSDLPILPYSRLTGSPCQVKVGSSPWSPTSRPPPRPGRTGRARRCRRTPGCSPGEKYLRNGSSLRHEAEVEQHLVPEARVQQVQHRVLDTADVEIDAARVGHAGGGTLDGLRVLGHPVPLVLRVDRTSRGWPGRGSAGSTSTIRPSWASCWSRGGSLRTPRPSPRSSSTSTHSGTRDSGGSGELLASSGSNVFGRVVGHLGQRHRQHRVGHGVGDPAPRRRRSGTARPSSAAG